LDQKLQHGNCRGDRLGPGSFQPGKDRTCQLAIFRVAFYMENEDARIEADLAVPPEKILQLAFLYCQDSLSVPR
jgi:hypothetical protein